MMFVCVLLHSVDDGGVLLHSVCGCWYLVSCCMVCVDDVRLCPVAWCVSVMPCCVLDDS